MVRNRIDKELVARNLVTTRSQAENFIKLGLVRINGSVIKKPSWSVKPADKLHVEGEQYVSRAALKLASITDQFALDFQDTIVLDVGSSTGGFTDYALQHGAKKVVAVDVGTDQLHPKLRADTRIELYEKTDIRCVRNKRAKTTEQRALNGCKKLVTIRETPDIVVADVSFISLRMVLPHISKLVSQNSLLIMMCKPQFEAEKHQINKGIIKNSTMRRQILKNFESWLKTHGFVVLAKADSQVAGTKGNVERFYKLKYR